MQSLAPGPLDWISTSSQVAGTVATFLAVAVALWVASRDGRRLRAEQSDREATQARLIIAGVHHEDGRWWVRTTNHSGAPVFGVEVVEVRSKGGVSVIEPVSGAPDVILDVLEAGETKDRAIRDGANPTSGVVVLRYVDAAGLRWHREGTGQPKRLLS